MREEEKKTQQTVYREIKQTNKTLKNKQLTSLGSGGLPVFFFFDLLFFPRQENKLDMAQIRGRLMKKSRLTDYNQTRC